MSKETVKRSRLDFIPELREKMKANLMRQGVDAAVIDAAFDNWDAGQTPVGPWQAGCFAVFNKVQEDIRAVG